MIRKIPFLTFLTLFLVSTFHLPSIFAQSPIPEGAEAMFGKGRIYDMKYSPDGMRLAVATSKGIWIYDAITHQPLHFLKKHEALVERIVFSPEGKRLAVGCVDGPVTILDAASGISQQQFTGHTRQVKRVAFASDGKVLVSLSDDGVILLWDVN